MPEKNTPTPKRAVAARPLPARFSKILVTLPVFAWVENSKGEILACNSSLTTPARVITLGSRRGVSGNSWKITTFPLPPIKGWPHRLRLVALVPDARENDCQIRVISALLALLLGAEHPDCLRLTPQQRDIYGELALGLSYKEAAYNLGITHNALLVQLTRMRNRLGDGIIPRLRRHRSRRKAVNGKPPVC